MTIVCFDIGGSFIRASAFASPDRMGTVLSRPTPPDSMADFIATVAGLVAACDVKPSLIAMSFTGVIEPESGTLICANIPCLHGKNVGQTLEEALGLPVLIANDADCFALAEAGLGAGRGHHVVLGAILGSGVGGGLVVGGKLANAAGGFAGEWGHGPVIAATAGDPPFPIPPYPCGCGQVRCLNTVGAARGMERLHFEIHRKESASRQIVEAWHAGDPDAARTIDIYLDLVASPLALAVNITGASIVPVGGGLASSSELIDAIDRTVRQRILRRFSHPLVVQAEVTGEPGLVGAALLGFGSLKQ